MTWTLRKLCKVIIYLIRTFGINPKKQLYRLETISNKRDFPQSHLKASKDLSLLELSKPNARAELNAKIRDRLKNSSGLTNSEETSQSSSATSQLVQPSHGQGIGQLSEEVQNILYKPPWTRNDEDTDKAHTALMCCNAFCDYLPHTQKVICRIGWYQKLEPGRVILKEGHPASGFYFLISGSIAVIQRKEDGTSEIINTIREGVSFGEIAILHRSKRTTTCVAQSWVELLGIGCSDYIDLSLRQAKLSYQYEKHLEFLKSIPLLNHLPLDGLKDHQDVTELQIFKPNQYIVKDSQKSEWIYIIVNGSCSVTKAFDGTNNRERRSTYPPESPLVGHAKATEAIYSQSQLPHLRRRKRVKSQIPPLLESPDQGMVNKGPASEPRSHLLSIKRITESKGRGPSKEKPVFIKLQVLGPKDLFGLSSIVHNEEPSISLISNGCECIKVSKDFFVKHTGTLDLLRSKVQRYPTQQAMLQRIREHFTWNIYKETLLGQTRRH